jgi:uncharacterized protein YbaP (TraB family)
MKLLLIASIVTYFSLCFGQTKSLLYEVKKSGYKTSYLYGTIHLVPDSLFLFTNKLKKTIARSDEIIFEIVNVDNKQLISELIFQKDKNTFDLFTDSQKDSVILWGSQITELDSELFQSYYGQLKPFNLLQLSSLKAMNNNSVTVDLELMKFADEAGVFKSELESIAVQISLFDQLPDSIMREMILNEMRQTKNDEQLKSELYQLYQSQDIEGLAKIINESDEASAFLDEFIVQRNKKWLPIIIDKSKNKSCFVAVGAGHLGGKDGLISLFQQAGFIVSPITF